MKKAMGFLCRMIIAALIVTGMAAMFFGAVLQESYKLHPVTAAEVQG